MTFFMQVFVNHYMGITKKCFSFWEKHCAGVPATLWSCGPFQGARCAPLIRTALGAGDGGSVGRGAGHGKQDGIIVEMELRDIHMFVTSFLNLIY